MFNKDFEQFVKGLDLVMKDIKKGVNEGIITTENMFQNNPLMKATTSLQETLADLGYFVPLSRVTSYSTQHKHIVEVSLGKNLISGSTDIEVNKPTRILKVSASFESKGENTNISEKAEFSVSIPEGFVLDNPKAEFKDGNLIVSFEKVAEEKETVKVKVTE